MVFFFGFALCGSIGSWLRRFSEMNHNLFTLGRVTDEIGNVDGGGFRSQGCFVSDKRRAQIAVPATLLTSTQVAGGTGTRDYPLSVALEWARKSG